MIKNWVLFCPTSQLHQQVLFLIFIKFFLEVRKVNQKNTHKDKSCLKFVKWGMYWAKYSDKKIHLHVFMEMNNVKGIASFYSEQSIQQEKF
jgi:hypothetical protein